MNEAEREMDLTIAELEQENRLMRERMKRLERVESSAKALVQALQNNSDYDVFEKAADALEKVLKEKP
jgi:hypothetical protein